VARAGAFRAKAGLLRELAARRRRRGEPLGESRERTKERGSSRRLARCPAMSKKERCSSSSRSRSFRDRRRRPGTRARGLQPRRGEGDEQQRTSLRRRLCLRQPTPRARRAPPGTLMQTRARASILLLLLLEFSADPLGRRRRKTTAEKRKKRASPRQQPATKTTSLPLRRAPRRRCRPRRGDARSWRFLRRRMGAPSGRGRRRRGSETRVEEKRKMSEEVAASSTPSLQLVFSRFIRACHVFSLLFDATCAQATTCALFETCVVDLLCRNQAENNEREIDDEMESEFFFSLFAHKFLLPFSSPLSV